MAEILDYRAYLNNMQTIYDKFPQRTQQLLEQGIVPELMVTRKEGCVQAL